MDPLSVALAQVNPTVGDLEGNAQLVFASAREAAAQGAQVVVFGEMVLTGYPIEDLALHASFRAAVAQRAEQLATELADAGLADLMVVAGCLGTAGDGRPTNTALVLTGGRIQHVYTKQGLPNYGVFDEYRIFAAGDTPLRFGVAGHRVGVAICEDIWGAGEGLAHLGEAELDLLLVLNGSPYERGKSHQRTELVRQRAEQLDAAVAYVNLVGGQDDLVFDGGSFVLDAGGNLLGCSARFAEEVRTVSVPPPGPAGGGTTAAVADHDDETGQMYDAIVLALADYVRKNGFTSVVLGLSGGIDSALVAAIAADALGAKNVVGVAMPSRYSSSHSLTDAEDLANRLGMKHQDYRVQPIEAMFDAFQGELALTGLAEENLQARIRGTILMALSNDEGHLVLAPGNKSELAVGYSTIYGDAVGGYAPLKDVSKTRVWELARFRNARALLAGQIEPIPENSISKAPSAELRPDQRDDQSLPDYDILDPLLDAYVERAASQADLVQLGFASDVVDKVTRLVDRAEWKRRQYPLGPKVTALAFGRDRRLPVTNAFREHPGASER